MEYNQTEIIKKINTFLKINKRDLALEPGYCHGLTLLWLYKMLEKNEKWYYDLVKKIVDTPEEKMSDIEIDIEKFIAHVEWLQQPEKIVPSIRQMDMDESVEIPKEMPVSSVFNPRQLDSMLELVIQPNKMICISGPDHSVGLFRRENKYYIYNPNYDSGIAKEMKTIKSLRHELIECLFSDFNHPTKKLSVTINVLGEDDLAKERTQIYKWIIRSTGVMTFCDDGVGPLYLACENHSDELAKMLLEKGALANKGTKNGRYPLLLCAYSGYNKLVKLLLSYDADPNIEGREGLPLYAACKNGHEEVIKTLLENGAQINKADRDGETAIFSAVEKDHKKIVKLLLDHGANCLHPRNDGDTPMDIAIRNKNWDTVAMMFLNVKTPHKRNMSILKRNKKHLLHAVDQLIKSSDLAQYESKEILKIINKISTKKPFTKKTTKNPELSRRAEPTQSNLCLNSLFHHSNDNIPVESIQPPLLPPTPQ